MSSSTLILCAILVAGSLGSPPSSRVPRLMDGRIVGGEDVRIEDHPYQLSFKLYGQHMCGASIISSKWAITAAHCVGASPTYYSVSAGSAAMNRGESYSVKKIIPHPQFDSMIIDYDMALVEISDEFEFSESVQPVELPKSEAQPGTVVNVTGWGALWQGGSSSKSLQKVEVPIVPRSLCNEAYSFLNEITPRMICAGDFTDGGKDSCQGDSGGPLVSDNILYGVVSWGYGCAQPNYPGVYTNVAALRDWVKETTGI